MNGEPASGFVHAPKPGVHDGNAVPRLYCQAGACSEGHDRRAMTEILSRDTANRRPRFTPITASATTAMPVQNDHCQAGACLGTTVPCATATHVRRWMRSPERLFSLADPCQSQRWQCGTTGNVGRPELRAPASRLLTVMTQHLHEDLCSAPGALPSNQNSRAALIRRASVSGTPVPGFSSFRIALPPWMSTVSGTRVSCGVASSAISATGDALLSPMPLRAA